ncbi:MAG: hypothetical protein WCR61_06700, partial [Bacteroidales bacterium]
MKRNILLFCAVIISTLSIAQPLKKSMPSSEGMDAVKLSNVDEIINSAIEKEVVPGAVLAVVRDNKMVYLKSYGNKSVYPKVEKMDV